MTGVVKRSPEGVLSEVRGEWDNGVLYHDFFFDAIGDNPEKCLHILYECISRGLNTPAQRAYFIYRKRKERGLSACIGCDRSVRPIPFSEDGVSYKYKCLRCGFKKKDNGC